MSNLKWAFLTGAGIVIASKLWQPHSTQDAEVPLTQNTAKLSYVDLKCTANFIVKDKGVVTQVYPSEYNLRLVFNGRNYAGWQLQNSQGMTHASMLYATCGKPDANSEFCPSLVDSEEHHYLAYKDNNPFLLFVTKDFSHIYGSGKFPDGKTSNEVGSCVLSVR